ncbi:MAG: class B sortase [Coriobacteriaceae bacterium]
MARHFAEEKPDYGDAAAAEQGQQAANVYDNEEDGYAQTQNPYSAGAEGTTIHEGYKPLADSDHVVTNGANQNPKTRKRKGEKQEKTYKRPVLRVLSTILLIAGIVLIALAGYLFWQQHERYQQQEEVNEQLAVYESGNESDAPVIDWAGLEAINSDVVGWVKIPGTVIDYPVYQGATNDTYLRHTATGEYSLGGQVFMDYQNQEPGMLDQQTLIYGHHLLDGSMFKAVSDMVDQATFDSHPTVWYVDENNTYYELEPLLVYKTVASDGNVRQLNFDTTDAFRQYLADLLDKASASRQDALSVIGHTDHVLTLVTCNYDHGLTNPNRTILICVPKSEAQDS